MFCVPTKRNVSEIVYVENLNCPELVEEHLSRKSESDHETQENEDDLINTSGMHGENREMGTGEWEPAICHGARHVGY